MSLNIKNQEAEELARQLAAATGESLTRAIATAVRERLDRVRDENDVELTARRARLRAIAHDAAGRWVEPSAGADHGDLLYDPFGLPR